MMKRVVKEFVIVSGSIERDDVILLRRSLYVMRNFKNFNHITSSSSAF